MHGLIPGAQLAVLPGTTHMGVMRRADLMVPLIRDFLRIGDGGVGGKGGAARRD